jgi:hypothetical protein
MLAHKIRSFSIHLTIPTHGSCCSVQVPGAPEPVREARFPFLDCTPLPPFRPSACAAASLAHFEVPLHISPTILLTWCSGDAEAPLQPQAFFALSPRLSFLPLAFNQPCSLVAAALLGVVNAASPSMQRGNKK